MGIKNRVIREYGQSYWDRNASLILSNADRYGSLNKDGATYNSKLRRRVSRHPSDYPRALVARILGSVLDGKPES